MIRQIGGILLISLVFFQRFSRAIQCYQCNSLYDKDCAGTSLNDKYLQECPETHNYCRKLIAAYYFKDPEEHFTLRECAALGGNECYKGRFSHQSYKFVCECKDRKGCNLASTIQYSFTSIFISQLILWINL